MAWGACVICSLKNENVEGCHESDCLAAGACKLHTHRRLRSVFTKSGVVREQSRLSRSILSTVCWTRSAIQVLAFFHRAQVLRRAALPPLTKSDRRC